MIVLERDKRTLVASPAQLVEGGPEVAWAESLIGDNPFYAWILGKFVSSGGPNANGHIFDVDELRAQVGTLVHAPLNLLHRPHHIMGHYVGAELVYPTDTAAASEPTLPHVESLSAMYRYYFRDEFESIRDAHAEGLLAQSMECVPRTVTCVTAECDQTFPYKGRVHETYCEHLRTGKAPPRKLNVPHFSAGAVVIPPARPAWAGAKVIQVQAASTVRQELDRAEQEGVADSLYHQVRSEFPHLSPREWEGVMACLMAMGPVADRATCRAAGSQLPRSEGRGRAVCRAAPALSKLIGPGMGTSAMVALYPSADVAHRLAIPGGEEPDVLHVTLAYLGPEAVLRLDREAVEAVLGPLATASTPLDGEVSGVGRFNAGYPAGQEPWPLYASIDIPALPEFRQRLVAALAAGGIAHARDHGFSPHMTLAYVGPDDEAAAAQVLAEGIEAVSLHFAEVVLAWGDDRIVFPLGGGEDDEDEGPDEAIAAIVASARQEAAAVLEADRRRAARLGGD